MSSHDRPEDATPDGPGTTDEMDDTAVRNPEEWAMDTTTDAARTAPQATRGGLHPVNLTHLIMGTVLAAFAGIWVAIEVASLPVDDLRWVLPVPWLLAGSAGLLAATLGRRRRERVTRDDGDVGVVGDHPVDPRR
ncbi:hypothetical protein [Nocardioides daphniae]|uniref:DUF2530 domain-containing protein n=1 Tax=Nocardioides daphniae TaxID=402297 RepID=A0A4P7UEJ4_9ACTN|nr:hypothetical protein [Nocardioides daphniae]QCC77951.1 hypothetical protein E2C04_13550 [Nocardioides daphniae]GGD23693.1 hypothetical protein GCM10007231_23520 [Nocardioides daphniae]